MVGVVFGINDVNLHGTHVNILWFQPDRLPNLQSGGIDEGDQGLVAYLGGSTDHPLHIFYRKDVRNSAVVPYAGNHFLIPEDMQDMAVEKSKGRIIEVAGGCGYAGAAFGK